MDDPIVQLMASLDEGIAYLQDRIGGHSSVICPDARRLLDAAIIGQDVLRHVTLERSQRTVIDELYWAIRYMAAGHEALSCCLGRDYNVSETATLVAVMSKRTNRPQSPSLVNLVNKYQ